MSRPLRIAPSILAADFARLGHEVAAIDKGGADWVHIDVMDGCFVPNISFGMPIIQSIRPHTQRFFDVHLMIADPDSFLAPMAAAGADGLTVHAEGNLHLHRTLQAVRALGKKAGVALSPATPVSAIAHVVDLVNLILVMTVNPGFGGQSFIRSMLEKVTQAKALAGGRDIDIEVDGGVTIETAPLAHRAGANVLVAGSAIFKGDHAREIKAIRNACATTA